MDIVHEANGLENKLVDIKGSTSRQIMVNFKTFIVDFCDGFSTRFKESP
jgi:hypothetical protein